MTHKIEMYATSYCRYCMDARDFFEQKGLDYDEYLLDLMPLEKNAMIQRCGQKSVPQIFINGQHIGGLSDLIALNKNGQFDKLMQDKHH